MQRKRICLGLVLFFTSLLIYYLYVFTLSIPNTQLASVIQQQAFIHFTHVFSSFKGPARNDIKEYDLVMQSWLIATKRAQEYGINIQHVDAILPEDVHSVPSFVDSVVFLRHKFKSVDGHKVPTVGEIFKVGSAGKGKWLIFTNSDIALVPDFYIKVWKFLNRGKRYIHESFIIRSTDFLGDTAMMKSFNELVFYKEKCLNAANCKQSRLCNEDSKVIYENGGGYPTLYSQISEDVALHILEKQIKTALPYWLCEAASGGINGLCAVRSQVRFINSFSSKGRSENRARSNIDWSRERTT